MFDFLLRVRALDRLGLGKPFKMIFIVVFFGALMAGLIYAFSVFSGLNEGSSGNHVQHHSTR